MGGASKSPSDVELLQVGAGGLARKLAEGGRQHELASKSWQADVQTKAMLALS